MIETFPQINNRRHKLSFPKEHPKTVRAIIAAAAIGALLAAAMLSAAPSRGQSTDHWFEMFSGPHGTRSSEMRAKATTGPFPLSVCYAVGAMALEDLNDKYPDEDFMGRCDGGDLLTMRALADRALALLPKERGGE